MVQQFVRWRDAKHVVYKYLVRVHSGRERHLNHDAVDVSSLVQGLHFSQHLRRYGAANRSHRGTRGRQGFVEKKGTNECPSLCFLSLIHI